MAMAAKRQSEKIIRTWIPLKNVNLNSCGHQVQQHEFGSLIQQ
jgi:hypothetical protein